ncbi:MAG: glycine--tRNA ligase [Chloroflexi bacterium]|nr:glycine--tRNA ligase [Chloroflexota bacterium]
MVSMDMLVSLCKRRGFIFPSSEIYGGFGSTWDYGPLGVELKRNIKDAWWRAVVQERDDMVGLDASILMHPRVWVASGHVASFADLLVDCKSCKQRFRADDLVEASAITVGISTVNGPQTEEEILAIETAVKGLRCPNCDGELTEPRRFNLMFRTFVGPVEDEANVTYLRPETAQGIFTNFKNVLTVSRRRLPFGIAQIGKAFRNEITPGNFIFRTREFEQMEIEYFVKSGTDEHWHRHWLEERMSWYKRCGLKPENLRLRHHTQDELAHYAKACADIEYKFPFGWAELEGIANRTDFDLRQHSAFSGEELTYFDEESDEHILPYVIEPSAGVDRSVLALLVDAYDEEPDKEGVRIILHLDKQIAPIKVAILPLSKKESLIQVAKQVWSFLRPHFMTAYDDAQSIGRRYRRQDEIGTPYCVTIDFQTLEDQAVTIRDRDTMAQIRVPIAELKQILAAKLAESSCS